MLAALVPQPPVTAPSLGTRPSLGQDVVVWLGGYDLSGALDSVNLQAARVPEPNTADGDTLEAFVPGPQIVQAEVAGFYSAGAGEPDTVVAPRIFAIGDFSEWPLTFLPAQAPAQAGGADGNAAYNVRSAQYGIRFGAQAGELLPFYLRSQPRAGRLDRMTVILPKATYSATTTGVARRLGSTTAAEKIVAVLHVFAVTGGTWTVTLESDVAGGFPSPAAVTSFTAAAGITRQTIEVPGPFTDDWWRAVLTKSGGTSCVLAVLIGKAPA